MGAYSNYAANQALALWLNQPGLYLACHTDDPLTATEPESTEVAGGGYLRQSITFAVPGSRVTASTNAQIFTCPAVTVTYLAVWTNASGGALICAVELPQPLVVQDGGTVHVEIGDLAFGL